MTKYGDVVQIQIQICKFKQGHSGEVGEAPQGENFPSPAIQPASRQRSTYLCVDLTAALSICRPTSIPNTDQLLIFVL